MFNGDNRPLRKELQELHRAENLYNWSKIHEEAQLTSKNVELLEIFSGIMPFLLIVILAMVLMYLFPGIALWLPETLFAN